MASNINPSLTPVNSLTNFKFWCQKVLPLVYDDSLSYYEVLGKMVVQLNDVIDNVNTDTENVLTLKDAFLELQTYVNNFFDDIDQLASYAERAEAAQTAANTSAVNAATSASNASASSLAAMDARDTAVTAKQAAETSANTASTAATNANTKANEAAQSAITAQTAQASASQSATLAATDRSAAQTAASTATTKANEASTSASNAETSAENASQSEANAEELVNNIQENLNNIQQNTQDINELKTAITDYIINAKTDFGAKGDGSTDDTTALQNCFDYAAEHGAIAFLPSGIYLVSAPLFNKGAHIMGASISIQEETPTTVIKASNSFTTTVGASNGVLNCLAQQTPYSDFIIENITINANSKQYNALNLRVSAVCNNVYCTGGLTSGLYCLNSYHSMFTGCFFNHNAKYGINIDQRNNSIEFINCVINDNGTASTDANVMIDNTTYNAVNNNACIYFVGCEIDKAIAGSNVSINGVDTLTFDACYFEQFSGACFVTRGLKVNALNIVNSYFLDVNFNLEFNGTFIGNAFRLINAASGIARATQPSGGDLLKAGNYYDAGYTTT